MPRNFFDYLSGGRLMWNKMPDYFERFVYPEIDFSVPSDPDRYKACLIERFPMEKKGIKRYSKDIRKVNGWNVLGFTSELVPAFIRPLLKLIYNITSGHALMTTKDYLDRHFKDTTLKALLASQWGDYGIPPANSAFAAHALIVGTYLKGAYFPVGGASRIARTFEIDIEARGGTILVCQEVVSIMLKNNT